MAVTLAASGILISGWARPVQGWQSGPADLASDVADRRQQLLQAVEEEPGDWSTRLDLARFLHMQGVAGNRKDSEQALGMLEHLVDERSEDPLALAYLGSAVLISAARTWAVWKKGRLAKEGIEMLDSAVELDPANLEVRFMRGASLRGLPAFFGQSERAEEDLAWVAERAVAASRSGHLEPSLGAAALFFHGERLDRQGDRNAAGRAWREAVDLAPGSRAGRDALRKLGKGDLP